MEILQTYDAAAAHLILNALASIAICKVKRLEFIAPAFTYVYIIQWTSMTRRGIGWYSMINHPGFLSTLAKPSCVIG